MLSRDKSLQLDTWNLLGTSGNVFDSPLTPIDSSSTPYQGMLHSWNQSATGGNPVRDSTGKPVAGSEERNRDTIPAPRFARKPFEVNGLPQSMFQSLRIWDLGKLRRVLCLRRRPNECWADHMKRTGVIEARQLKKHNQPRMQTLAMRRAYCCLANGELSE